MSIAVRILTPCRLLAACLLHPSEAGADDAGAPIAAPGRTLAGDVVTLRFSDRDAARAEELRDEVAAAQRWVEEFFGRPFPRSFEVVVFPDRAALDAHWRELAGVPDLRSDCWMVASGTATELALLSPAVWQEQACEHEPADAGHLRRLLAAWRSDVTR